jgi:transketolase N-terminal domain/subunit
MSGGSVTLSVRPDTAHLERLARDCRRVVLEMVHRAGSGHLGSALSCVEILTVLTFHEMERGRGDVFVLSKGHAVPAWYAALIVAGELDADLAPTLRTLDSPLQGHPDRSRLPLVDVSTGALGWHVQEADGHSVADLQDVLVAARAHRDRPSVVVARTRKGWLGPGRVVLEGAHAGVLTEAEFAEAVHYLRAGR